MPLAGRTTTCGLCNEKIMKGIDRYAWWATRTVHEHCKERAAQRIAESANVTDLGTAEHDEEIPVTRPRLKAGNRGTRFAPTRRQDGRTQDGRFAPKPRD
jgi:hypothetical protein